LNKYSKKIKNKKLNNAREARLLLKKKKFTFFIKIRFFLILEKNLKQKIKKWLKKDIIKNDIKNINFY